MQIKNRWMASALAMLVVGCGGGGSGSTSTTSAPTTKTTPASVILSGSNGDMSKYLGNWVSDCGFLISDQKYIINDFTFTSIAANSITGQLTSKNYSDSNCAGTILYTNYATVTITFLSNATVGNTDSTGVVFSGSADNTSMTVLGSTAAPASLKIGFFESFGKFKLTNSAEFSNLNITYKKYN